MHVGHTKYAEYGVVILDEADITRAIVEYIERLGERVNYTKSPKGTLIVQHDGSAPLVGSRMIAISIVHKRVAAEGSEIPDP